MPGDLVITKGRILKYAFMPGILPRLRGISGNSPVSFPYLLAVVYNSVRILPDNHVYLRSDSIGKYGVRQVIAEAANHIVVDKNNIDQILMFLVVLVGIAMLVMQFVLLVSLFIVTPAFAAYGHGVTMPTDFSEFFVTPNPDDDLAYRALDLIFGLDGMYNSSEDTGQAMHRALQAMFEFYSFGIMAVGFLIVIYQVISIIGETAQSGTPFGKRFNHVWVPIRYTVFLGLILPVASGYNGGQLITLYSAKWGSSIATNAWVTMDIAITREDTTYAGDVVQLVGTPKAPDLGYLPAFMMLARTCYWAHGRMGTAMIEAYAVYSDANGTNVHTEQIAGTTYSSIVSSSKGAPVYIVFGEYDPDENSGYFGDVQPYCGELYFPVSDVSEPGSMVMQNGYFEMIKAIWASRRRIDAGDCGSINIGMAGSNRFDGWSRNYTYAHISVPPRNMNAVLPTANMKRLMVGDGNLAGTGVGLNGAAKRLVDCAVQRQIEDGNWSTGGNVEIYGWMAAGSWFNKIAQQNGALASAVAAKPVVSKLPQAMEHICKEKRKRDRNISPEDCYSATLAQSDREKRIEFEYTEQEQIALALGEVYKFWKDDKGRSSDRLTKNAFVDAANLLLGTSGLYNMCSNMNIHPLAQLSIVGKSLIDSALSGFAISFAGSMVALGLGQSQIGGEGIVDAFASMYFGVASIGLMVGFVLFYIVPFMPFMYFFFGALGWVKGIFEAMVGVPLWALAHLRLDGQGLPGDAALDGYHLIFEIFIRPVLLLMGLIAAVVVFAGLIKALNEIFYFVVANVTGSESSGSAVTCLVPPGSVTDGGNTEELVRGPIDELFYTVLYAIVVYMCGMSCFKMIDTIPNFILRWIGSNATAFNDNRGEPVSGLTKYVTAGGGAIGSQLSEGIGSVKENIKAINIGSLTAFK